MFSEPQCGAEVILCLCLGVHQVPAPHSQEHTFSREVSVEEQLVWGESGGRSPRVPVWPAQALALDGQSL